MAPVARDGKQGLTVDTYRPGEYIEATWHVVSDRKESLQFVPISFDRVAESTQEVDGMFADFTGASGGIIELSSEAGDFDLQPIGDHGFDRVSTASEMTEVAPSGKDVEDDNKSTRAALRDDILEAVSNPGSHRPASESRMTQANYLADQVVQTGLDDSHHDYRLEELRREAVATQEQLEERYSLLWEDMQTQLEETQRLNEVRAVDLALQVAKRLVGDVVEHQRDYIHQVIHDAIKVASGAEISAIRVSPRDYDFLKLTNYGDSKKFLVGQPLKFVSDESIRAGCVLVTSAGEVDYDLDAAWERIRSKVQQEPES